MHDLGVSSRICSAVDVPVYRAGGLNPKNVGRAIVALKPYGLDICGGLRTGGRLDATNAQAFMAAVDEINHGEEADWGG